jgi:hypothetical protein
MDTKPSLAGTIRHRGKSYLLKELPETNGLRLTELERRIIDARLIGLSLNQLESTELKTSADQIMLQAAAITGCPFPQTDFFAGILANTMMDYLKDFGFGELTLEEIILAMKLNTKGGLRLPSGLEVDKVVFTGLCFNVDFLSKILSNYMVFRNSLDRKFENFIDGYQ